MSVSSSRRPVLSLWVIFFLNGAVLASWTPRIPDVAQSLSLSDTDVGVAILGVAAGSIPAVVLSGRLLRRMNARLVCTISALIFTAALPLIAVATNAAQLTASLALLGACVGTLDVAMNTSAIAFGRTFGRPVLSRLHGGYSLGVLGGASGGAVAVTIGASVLTQFSCTSLILFTAAAWASRGLPRTAEQSSPPDGTGSSSGIAISPPVGALAVSCLLIEGTITDWSALLVSRDFGSGTSVGAATVALFSLAMFTSRSAADALTQRIGGPTICRAGGAVTALAMTAGLLQPHPLVLIGAVIVAGLAIGPMFPLAIESAGRHRPDYLAAAAAHVSAVGYLAYLGGPPLVGLAADMSSLPVVVGVVAVASGVTIALTAGTTATPPEPR